MINDLKKQTYSKIILDKIGIPEKLFSEIGFVGEIVGTVTK